MANPSSFGVRDVTSKLKIHNGRVRKIFRDLVEEGFLADPPAESQRNKLDSGAYILLASAEMLSGSLHQANGNNENEETEMPDDGGAAAAAAAKAAEVEVK